MKKRGGLVFAVTLFLGWSTQALAWDIHRTLMPSILEAASPALKDALLKTYPTPCEMEDRDILKILISTFQLNPATQVPLSILSSPTKTCGATAPMSAQEILLASAVDDPDQGMDRDLPAEYDPSGDRTWMGGLTGPSSQGYRHMYFAGWKSAQPLTTFQIPPRALGQAPMRTALIANKSRELVRAGGGAWSIRTLGWALHYTQDLAQPFHAAQVIQMKMIPWFDLLSWPPSQAFNSFKQETIRTVSNYHWALEGYVRTRLYEGANSPFVDCLKNPKQYSNLVLDQAKSPREIAEAVAKASVELVPEFGMAEMDFFSMKLMQKSYNLSSFIGEMDYAEYATRPDLTEKRAALHKVVCRALANASIASLRLMEWVLLP